jgi:DNA mismatch endonuclease (patch repair protein)
MPLLGKRRRADVVFTRAKLAVFVDGCFWHGCPTHGTWPKNNAAWWRAKIEANQRRDRDTDRALRQAGWTVFRFWEHTDSKSAARRVRMALKG